jgi:hypothetical protein
MGRVGVGAVTVFWIGAGITEKRKKKVCCMWIYKGAFVHGDLLV